jgi:hypothetical protein
LDKQQHYYLIRKQITEQKRQQAAASAGGSGSMGSSLMSMGMSLLGFASGGAVSKGQPIMVGEQGARIICT